MWYKTGTISVSNGSKTVTGVNTGWVANIRTGDGFQGPDGKLYEVSNVASDTSISIEPAYVGATAATRPYWIIPVQGYVRKLADKAAQLLQSYNDVLQHTGQRADALMSQKAVTDELALKVAKSQVKQALGTSTTDLMSQKVTTDELTLKAVESSVASRLNLKADKTKVSSDLIIIHRDTFRDSVELASGGKNTVLYDDQGKPNVMVIVPRFNYEDLDLGLGTGTVTAFLTKGVPKSEILVGKYLLSDKGVVGGEMPKVSQNFDQFKALIQAKGTNWRMLSQHDWAAVSLWSLANGTIPRGNTNHGRAHDKLFETGRRSDGRAPGDSAGIGSTRTGSGPATWSHDHTDFGVCDLVGNVWEWVDQYKIVDGQVFYTLDNDPLAAESTWIASGLFMDGTGNSLTYTETPTNISASSNAHFKDVAPGTNELLGRLLAEPVVATADIGGLLYWVGTGERLPNRGGSWRDGANSGLSTLNLYYSRSYSSTFTGCRPASF